MSATRPDLAPTPPMGWNSFDCFSSQVTEDEVKENAEYLARHLKPFGYEYVVVDIEWQIPSFKPNSYHAAEPDCLDEYGRFLPATRRFPSAAGGKGFKPLADYIHSLGLKFGIHILRGIPRVALEANTPILGSPYRAADVADTTSRSAWASSMWGLPLGRPGAQEYYDSLLDLYVAWEVDFIKADDISKPYLRGEVEMLRRAIDRCGRRIVLSLSPGETPRAEVDHLYGHAEMWRVSTDIWDRWACVERGFELTRNWQGVARPGCWPDADMLPFGYIEIHPAGDCIGPRWTRLSRDEQVSFMTLWCIFRSPLMIGSHLPKLDDWTLALLTNPEVLEIVKHSSDNREVHRTDETICWSARSPAGAAYLAVFNRANVPRSETISLSAAGATGPAAVRDLWLHQDLGWAQTEVTVELPAHGCKLLRLSNPMVATAKDD